MLESWLGSGAPAAGSAITFLPSTGNQSIPFGSLKDALAYINNGTLSGLLSLPVGTTVLAAPTAFPNNVTITGQGDGTVLSAAATSQGGTIFSIVGTVANAVNVNLRNLKLAVSNYSAGQQSNLLVLGAIGAGNYCGPSTLTNVTLAATDVGIFTAGNANDGLVTIDDCRFMTGNIGINTPLGGPILLQVKNSLFNMPNGQYGVSATDIDTNSDIRVEQCEFTIGNATSSAAIAGIHYKGTANGSITLTNNTVRVLGTAVLGDIYLEGGGGLVYVGSNAATISIYSAGSSSNASKMPFVMERNEQWMRFNVNLATMQDAANNGNVVVLTALQPNYAITASRILTDIPFASPLMSALTVSLGIASSTNKYGDVYGIMGTTLATGSLTVASTNQFIRASGSFSGDGVQVGDNLNTSGFSNSANNGTFTVASRNTGTLTITGTSLVAEAANASRTIIVAKRTNSGLTTRAGIEAGGGVSATNINMTIVPTGDTLDQLTVGNLLVWLRIVRVT